MAALASTSVFLVSILRAIQRAKWSILTIAATYVFSITGGIVMVNAGSPLALKSSDQIVNQANQQSQVMQAANRGNGLQAALLDFAGNLFVGAVPKTVSGFAIIFPYPLVAYQGWVGGIVSVRGDHSSRLNDPRSAFYYLLTLVLQVIPYSLAVGAGVNAGIAMLRPAEYYQGEKWLNLVSKEALRDVGRIYALVAPLFLLASLWEFLGSWNF
jgi:uncharacterized membrane protein SpoIIM required for sporulation